MSSIPKIIHQIAPADQSRWHVFWNPCHESWKKNFPDYKFMLWNDQEDIDIFVKENYKQYWNLYKAFPFHIMRIDFVRLCLLDYFGGIYADMDVFCYKNFNNYLTKDVYFLENKIFEYTDSQFENSMMASVPKHRLIQELTKYCKTSFITFRNEFKVDENTKDGWRSVSNDNKVNNSTGSGMISAGIRQLAQYFDVGKLECKLFNNRPGSYDKSFYTKHVHTSVWGNEYLNIQPSRVNSTVDKLDSFLIINGSMYSANGRKVTEETIQKIKDNGHTVELINAVDFNFYKDYTNKKYLTDNNLDEINSLVKKR